MPEGWVVGLKGEPILDPNRADEGYLMPIGGYKGSGLNIALGLLAGVLNGAAFGAEVIDHRKVPGQAANTGQAMFVMRPTCSWTSTTSAPIDHHLDSLRAAGHPGEVHLPGDMAARLEEEQSVEGIPVGEVLLGQLRDLAERLELDDRLD